LTLNGRAGLMKFKGIGIVAILFIAIFNDSAAFASQRPVIESIIFSSNEVDVLNESNEIRVELIVSHPNGIENQSIILTLSDLNENSLNATLIRVDAPINTSLTKVVFRGNLQIPRNIPTGVYNYSFSSIKNNSSAGYQFSADSPMPKKLRDLVGGENGLLIRSGGELNLNYETFVGPSYNKGLGIVYNNQNKYSGLSKPIWRVGEQFDPIDYFELRVPSLGLQVSTTTPSICSSDGSRVSLISEGLCTFKVFTSKTSDYALRVVEQSVTITSARLKPTLAIQEIASQTAKDLPKSIEIFRVYSASEGYVLPLSTTPSVCFASGFIVRIVGGGTCTLTYQTKETATYLESDLYKVTFEVVRDAQTISFTPPSTANISAKTLALSATASGGGVITYQTSSTGICSITGSTLNLLKGGNCAITATQAGSATLAPISATATVMIAGSVAPTKKTITCVKGNKTKKVSGTNPKCPKGYKVKR
jgi:hypothetical protein